MTEIQIVHGDFRVYEITITDEITGLPYDLTDSELTVTVADRPGGEAIFVKTEADGIVVQDQNTDTGIALLSVEPEDTLDLANDWNRYSFDVKVFRNGLPITPIRGSFRVIPSVGAEELSS